MHELKNLRVAVVPTETGNDITQRSEIEEVLKCKDTIVYYLTEYFQAQNDDELPLHFSFLYDRTTNEEISLFHEENSMS